MQRLDIGMTKARRWVLWTGMGLFFTCEGGPLESGSTELESLWAIPDGHLTQPPRVGPISFIVSGCPVAAVDPVTGAVLWEADGPCGSRVSPRFMVLGDVVVASVAGLYAVDGRTGVTFWHQEDAPNAVVAGTASDGLFATDGSILIAYDLETGAERWRAELRPGGGVNLGAGHGLVCAERLVSAPGDARIECFSTADGRIQWSRPVGTAAWVVVTPKVVVVAGADREFETGWIGLDPKSGETLWVHTEELPNGGPAVSAEEDVIYTCAQIGGSASDCLALRAIDGGILWRRDLPAIYSPPALGGDLLFVTTHRANDQLQFETSIQVLYAVTGVRNLEIRPSSPLTNFSNSIAVMSDILIAQGCCSYLAAYRLP